MPAFSRIPFSLAFLLSCKLKRLALATAFLALAPAAALASNTFVVINQPNTTFGSGGNLGVIMVAEENNGVIVPNASITLAIGAGTTSAGPFTTGQATYTGYGTIVPPSVNGVTTFDLSTVPLYAYAGGGTQSYTVTYSDTNTGATPLQATITVTVPTHLYIVTSFTDGTGSCPDLNYNGFSFQSGCTLRTALTNAATLTVSQSATIAFSNFYAGAWPQTLSLTSSLSASTLNWVANLTLMGPGANNLFISGGSTPYVTTNYQLLKQHSGITSGPLYLSGLTLMNGYIGSDAAALYLYGSTSPSFINNVNFYGNKGTSSGAAVYVPSTATEAYTLNFNNCIFMSNVDASSGGAIALGPSTGSLNINNSAFIGNQASTNGGAISISTNINPPNSVSITNSYFYSNTATGNGGALNLASTGTGLVYTLSNDTFYKNSDTGSFGGAIYLGGAGNTSTVTDLTVVGNSNTSSTGSGGGIYSTASLTLNNSVVEGNSVIYSGGVADLACTGSCNVNSLYASTSGSISPFTYPGLAGLGLSDPGPAYAFNSPSGSTLPYGIVPVTYGGPTQTLVPMPGSQLIAAGNMSYQGSIVTDQRGITRGLYGSTDIGAVQTVPSLSFSVEPPTSVNTGASFYPNPVVSYTDNGYSLTSTSAPLPVTLTESGGTLAGNTTAYMTSGSASFSSFDSTTSGYNFTLTATAGSGSGYGGGTNLAVATSTPYSVYPGSSNLVFTSYPTSTIVVGYSSANFNVNVEDSYGNTANSSAQIHLAITGPTGYGGYSTNVNASNGVATFSSLPVLTIAGSYTYTVTSSGLSTAAAFETASRVTTATSVSESSSSSTYGTQVALTATLSPASYGSATTNGEAVNFTVNGISVGSATLSSGTATLNTANFPTGRNTVVATYAGDATFIASTSTGLGQTSTPPPTTPIAPTAPTATAYLPAFAQNFTLGSIVIANYGTYGAGFTNSGSGSCAPNSAYGPSGTSSCNVGLNYSRSGGGLQTAVVEIFDSNGVLQGITYIVVPRYR